MISATPQRQDPVVEHADLFEELPGTLREPVVRALRHSVQSGWPASRESVRALVSYAQGRISSREYGMQVMVALGYADARTAVELFDRSSRIPMPVPAPMTAPSRFDATAGYEFLIGR